MNPVKVESNLYRENGRWVVSMLLPDWLAVDLLLEMESTSLVNLTSQITMNQDNEVEFVQMPLAESAFTCHNCNAVNTLPIRQSVEKPTLLKRFVGGVRRLLHGT